MNEGITGYYPSRSAFEALQRALSHRLREAIDHNESVVIRHNAYVDYCLTLLFLASGHRPVIDPFPDLDLFSTKLGLLLISDKVVADEREWRMVALPPIACGQLKAYVQHLKKMPSRLLAETRDARLPSEIRDLTDRNRAGLPLFFYLEADGRSWRRASPSELETRLADSWPLHIGLWRHATATEIFRQTRRADWAELQLGHIEGLDHPLGKTSTVSVLDALQPIAQALEEALQRSGWQCVPPPLKASPRAETAWREVDGDAVPTGSPYPPFGHHRRRMDRDKRRARAAPIVRQLLSSMFDEGAGRPSRQQIELAWSELLALAKSHGIPPDHCIAVFHRYIRRLPGGSDALRRARPVRSLTPEPSPFAEDTLRRYRRLQRLRQAFVEYLKGKGKEGASCSVARRIAEIRLSAALFSGLFPQDRQNSLQRALPSRLYKIEQQLFVDLPLTEAESSPTYRWFPDPVSTHLLAGLASWTAADDIPRWPTNPEIAKAHDALLNTLEAGLTTKGLAGLVQSGLTLEMPGLVAAAVTGSVPSVSLPLPQWVRLHRGEALHESVPPAPSTPERSFAASAPSVATAAGKSRAGEGGRFLSALRACTSQVRRPDPVGNVRPNSAQKAALAARMEESFIHAPGWSQLAFSIASWGIALCKRGTRSKANLAYSTITKYLMTVATALYANRQYGEFLSLDSLQYETIYLDTLVDAPGGKADYLFGRLLEFHDYLFEAYSVDEPDWSVVAASAGRSMETRYSDANLLTEEEYLRIFQCLNQLSGLNEALRTQYAVLVLLGYRFNLRFSEAWRLQYRDWQGDQDFSEVFLTIRPNVFGDLKSRSGVRVIPLLESLTEVEAGVLRKLLDSSEQAFKGDPLTPLMGMTAGTRELIGRHDATQMIHSVMRSVLGDWRIRYHHLRHTWVTRMAEGVLRPDGPTLLRGPDQSINVAVMVGDEKGHPFRSVTTAVGHASEQTTIASYVHCLDSVAAEWSQRRAPSLPEPAAAYALGVSDSTLRVRHNRGKGNDHRWMLSSVGTPDVQTAPYGDCDDIPDGAAVDSVTPMDVYRIVTEYAYSDYAIAQIADRLMMSQETVQAVVAAANALERESGYERYRLYRRSSDPILSTVPKSKRDAPKRPSRQENRRVECLLDRMCAQDLAAADWRELRQGTEAWIHSFRAPNFLLVTNLSDLRALRDLIRLVDRSVTCSVLAPDDGVESLDAAKIEELGLEFLGYAPLPLSAAGVASRRKARVCLSPDLANSESCTHQTLHRALYHLAVFVRVRVGLNWREATGVVLQGEF
ncbi:site-specific integrase [Thioalkalivibrio sp. ALE11]|uniref:site-specific integrase n=1 Tax=Thioalkalivibrio sp. ALE11 TaxID=1265494 RepID=UPI0003A4F48C|nr:site-specific integrase [Thioalkalivibrio sp. ALE11]